MIFVVLSFQQRGFQLLPMATATVKRELLSPSAVAVFLSRCYQRLAMFCWFCFGLSLLLDALTQKKYLFTFQNQKFRKNLIYLFTSCACSEGSEHSESITVITIIESIGFLDVNKFE